MCGLAGAIKQNIQAETWRQTLGAMASAIRHRGPDDSGIWYDLDAGVGLCHTRLSILDLSTQGHQPMMSAQGRYVIVFNGEIYNYQEVRLRLETELGRSTWRGHSDTEVMLAAIEHWGIHNALKSFNGMFAFALWDKQERKLYLARDRLGEKPLYYGWSNGVFLFGSELKPLRTHSAWHGEIDRDALTLYMRHNYIPAPFSIYKGIFKLPPASLLTISLDKNNSTLSNLDTEPELYWSCREVAEKGRLDLIQCGDVGAANELERLLLDAVGLRMEADVPLGAFLSGGVDSSCVVALMQAQSTKPVKTFSIGFSEKEYNEAGFARSIAEHLGTEHTELIVTPEQAMSVIPSLSTIYDEPFSDASQIPTFIVSRMAKEHVTVALSGDGGDELFGGYNRYVWVANIWNNIRWMPPLLRLGVAAILNSIKPQSWDHLFRLLGPVFPRNMRQRMPGEKLQKLADIIVEKSPELMYQKLISFWQKPEDIVIGGNEPLTILTDPKRWPKVNDFTHHMMYQDMVGYMPDDILTKLDRVSMAISLETRVPLLDHRLVEFSWKIPTQMKIRNRQGKWLLRKVLYRYVPKELIERPKMGFAIPIGTWLKGPLRDWAEDLLDERRLREEGFFYPGPIRKKWCEHLSGKRNRQYQLWSVLMFQAWLQTEKNV